MSERYDAFNEKGLSILAVFQSPPESIRRYVGRQNPPFPLIPDPEHQLYGRYAVRGSVWAFIKGGLRIGELVSAGAKGFMPGKMEGKTTMVPADFLIGPDLTVGQAYYGRDIGDHLPFADIDRWMG